MKNLLFYPKNQIADNTESLCDRSVENVQKSLIGNELDSKKDLRKNTSYRNTSDFSSNLEFQTSDCSTHNKANTFLTFSKTHFERYFPLADDFVQSKQDNLEGKIKSSEEPLNRINCATNKNVTADYKETPISFIGTIKAEKFDEESNASFQKASQIQDELLNLNKNNGIDNLILLPSEEEFGVNLSSNELFRGKSLLNFLYTFILNFAYYLFVKMEF